MDTSELQPFLIRHHKQLYSMLPLWKVCNERMTETHEPIIIDRWL